jgi:hypothetical protein
LDSVPSCPNRKHARAVEHAVGIVSAKDSVAYREEALEDAPVLPEHLLGAGWREEAQIADLAQVEHVKNALETAHICCGQAGCHRGLGGAGE